RVRRARALTSFPTRRSSDLPFAVWTWDDNRTGWGALLGPAAGGADVPAHAAPARVADPAGLPPAYIEVGQLDIFRDEDLTYAMRSEEHTSELQSRENLVCRL